MNFSRLSKAEPCALPPALARLEGAQKLQNKKEVFNNGIH